MLLILFLIVRFGLKLRPRQPVGYKIHVRKDIENFKSYPRTRSKLHLVRQVRSIFESKHRTKILETGTESDTNINAEEAEGNVFPFDSLLALITLTQRKYSPRDFLL